MANHWWLLERDPGDGPLTDEQVSILISEQQSPSVEANVATAADNLRIRDVPRMISALRDRQWSPMWTRFAVVLRSEPESFIRALTKQGLT